MSRPFAGRSEHGAGAVEYGAVVVLVAAIAGGLYAAGIPEKVGADVGAAVCDLTDLTDLTGGTGCGGSDTPGSGEDERDDITTMQYPADPGGQVCLPLCDPERGNKHLDDWPEPPIHPEQGIAIDSAEEYDQTDIDDVSDKVMMNGVPGHQLEIKRTQAYNFATGGDLKGMDNASGALKHFLDGSGETKQIDADDLRKDVPEFDAEVKKANKQIGADAIADAKKRGVTEPVTYPVSTEWNAFGYNKEGTGYIYDDADWINTLGSWQYNQVGEVTVYPPAEPDGEWTQTTTTQTNVKKYYDWDEDKTGPAVKGPMGIESDFSEQDLWNMHRTGIAQEFWIEGSTDKETTVGTG
ncbi:hypothetical protein CLV63_11357 [Murinocardiopsis flavida]|uniref:Uncharacterized protein n=1 Tax=Murinocardiopsis flavida TaxID=645275 RepID=A0A2P8DFA6_9ACTN|nr:hypothetical protein [Murinocardiopsis flavida]PSK95894.1 hypothetical protein CLV63_11357 [Murinocardiopsis flavida]